MSYDPLLTTLRDRIRKMVGDTDVASEFFLDSTYDAEIVLATSNWKLAAASMAESLAVVLEQRVNSFTATGDVSLSWSDRTRSLRLLASRLRAEAASEIAAAGSGIVSVSLNRGTSDAAEYRASRYRRLVR